MTKLEERKKAYKFWRDKIHKASILFIAESPPKNTSNYFYFTDKKINQPPKFLSDHLFSALNIKSSNRKKALTHFVCKKRYFLIDAIENPKFTTKGKLRCRKKQILENEKRIKEELNLLKPKKIIVIGKTIYNVLCKLDIGKLTFVYFPTNWIIKEKNKTGIKLFNEKLKRILKRMNI